MLWNILQYLWVGIVVLLLFNFTIFFHELGHYLVGRWRGATIERFAIWFGPAIWKTTIDGVEFRLGCIPLGGYVAFPQLAMESVEGKSEKPPEKIKPLRPRDKIPILLAGSCANLIFGFFVACLVWIVGLPRDASYFDLKVGHVEAGSAEETAGIMPGDRIKAINGTPVEDWEDITQRVALSLSEKVRIGLERNTRFLEVELTPSRDHVFEIRKLDLEPATIPVAGPPQINSPAARAGVQAGDEFLELDGEKLFGPRHLSKLIRARADKPTRLLLLRNGKHVVTEVIPVIEKSSNAARIGVPLTAKAEGREILTHPSPWKQMTQSFLLMANTFNALLHSKKTGVGVGDLSGPVGITLILVLKTLQDFRETLYFLVMLNINLAIINLLPIPVLDGGHIGFTLIEALRRKPINQKFIEGTQTVFVVLLLTLMLYITFNDFRRIKRMKDAGLFGGKGKSAESPPPTEFQKK